MSQTTAAAALQDDEISGLPEWDLGDLYASPDAPELARDLREAEAAAKAFAQRYKGELAAADGDVIGDAVIEYERMSEVLGRVMSYAQLHYSGNVADPARGRFYQSMQERVTAISTDTLFFTLELNRLEDDVLEGKLASPKLARYRPWLRDLRVFRKHQLSDDLERLLHEKDVTGRASWVRLFDETMAELRFPLDGKELTATEVLHLMSDKNPDTRRRAGQALGAVLGSNIRTFSLITNVLAKDKEIEDQWRGYPHPGLGAQPQQSGRGRGGGCARPGGQERL